MEKDLFVGVVDFLIGLMGAVGVRNVDFVCLIPGKLQKKKQKGFQLNHFKREDRRHIYQDLQICSLLIQKNF